MLAKGALMVTVTAVGAAMALQPELVTPPWNYALSKQGASCVDASEDHLPFTENNTRWSFYALPEGAAPAGGWPIYIDFLAEPYGDDPELFPNGKLPGKCGNGWMDPDGGWGPPLPPSCLDFLATACPRPKFQAQGVQAGEAACSTCYQSVSDKATAANCSSMESRTWCSFDPSHAGMGAPNYRPFETPAKALASCFDASGAWNLTGCTFNQFAGELWNARLHQFLLANGIAVVQLNPYTADTWEWYTPDLPIGAGLDQPYFKKLFAAMQAGTYAAGVPAGALNTAKLIVSGYSSGAQMSSWMMELDARGALPHGVSVAAGVFFSGGSHMCYMNPPEAVSQCKQCQTGGSGFRRLQPGMRGGCSTTVAAQGGKVECDFCCPTNVTEMYYRSNPAAYAKHPPVFLAQSEASDMNADLCAAKNYYQTAKAHSVTAELVLLPGEFASSYCMGNSSDQAAQGSPFIDKTASLPTGGSSHHFGGGGCVDHTMGFAAVVVPLTEFLMKALAASS